MDRPSRRISGGTSGKGSGRHPAVGGAGNAGERAKPASGVARPGSGLPRPGSGLARPGGKPPSSSVRPASASSVRRDSPSGVRRDPGSGLRKPSPTPAPAPTRPGSSRIKGAGKHFPNPVETAAGANPLYAGNNSRARNRRGAGEKANPMLYVYIGIGVVVLGGIAFAMMSSKKNGGAAPANTASPVKQAGTPGGGLVVTGVNWIFQKEGIWSVAGTIENKSDQEIEKIVIAFYPCGEEPRIKSKEGTDIAIVTSGKVPRIGPGESAQFYTTPNPPAIQPGSMSTFPEKRSTAHLTWRGGPSLPMPIQEAIFDPLDREDWGGEETDWAKKRKKGSGAK